MADSVKRMVRKQLNIERAQDDAIKRLALVRGVSESEVVREAIDELVERDEAQRMRAKRGVAALDALFAEWDEIPFGPVPEGLYRFGVYDDI